MPAKDPSSDFLRSLWLSTEMALRGGDHRQVEDSEVQRQPQRKLQEASPQPEASQWLRQWREGLRLRGSCLQTLQSGETFSQAALIRAA